MPDRFFRNAPPDESFPRNQSLRQIPLSQELKSGSLADYLQCDLQVSEHLTEQFAQTLLFLKIPPNVNKTLFLENKSLPK